MADPVLTFDLLEQNSAKYSATLVDENSSAIPAALLTTLTLSLYVVKSDGTTAYVNSRNGQNILNQNGVTVSSAGVLVWVITPLDTTLVEALPFERHLALFQWTWGGGKAGKHEVVFNIKNLLLVT